MQLVPAATLPPQVVLSAKSPLFTPVTKMLVILSVPFPPLVSVAACAVLVVPTVSFPNARLDGDRVALNATPVPDRARVCGLPLALSVMLREAVREPDVVGLKVT